MQFSCRGESIAPVQKMNGLGIDSCVRLHVQVEFVINVYGRRNFFLPLPKPQRERPEKFRPGERGCEPRPQHVGVMLHQLSYQANWESLCESIKNPWIMDPI